MNKIEIYINKTCPYCKSIKEELIKENIKFTEKDTFELADEYQDVVNLTGLNTVPTIKCNNQYFIPGRDFQNPQQLVSIFKNLKSSPYSESKQVLEKVKTLNYNINMAFGRLDQLLRQIENKIKE
tara:strand:+ start:168 stop:542 length:375 start_codon:yes stop_codon:yes gene_type:complete